MKQNESDLSALLKRSIEYMNSLTSEQREEIYREQRESFARNPLKQMSNIELIVEYKLWKNVVQSATSWGASLGQAKEFLEDCEREIVRREINMGNLR